MASRMAMRYVSRRFSSSGRVLSEEEKAAENVYIKKIEQEKLEKLARKSGKRILNYFDTMEKSRQINLQHDNHLGDCIFAALGPKPEEAATGSGGSGSVADAKPSAQSSSTPGVSTDKYRNYAVVAGVVTLLGAGGWYLLSKDKKAEEVHD